VKKKWIVKRAREVKVHSARDQRLIQKLQERQGKKKKLGDTVSGGGRWGERVKPERHKESKRKREV